MHKLAEWIDKEIIGQLKFTGYTKGKERKNYILTLRNGRKSASFTAFCGNMVNGFRNGHAVLELVASDAQYARDMDLREFSRDLGYEGREAEQIYKACQESLEKLTRIFGADTDTVIDLYTSGDYMEEDEDGDE